MEKDKFLKFLERVKKIDDGEFKLNFIGNNIDMEKLFNVPEIVLNELVEIKNKLALAYAIDYVLKMMEKELTLDELNEILEGINIIIECPKYAYFLKEHLTNEKFIKEGNSLEGARYITKCPNSDYIKFIENIYAVDRLKNKDFYIEIILRCKNVGQVRWVYQAFLDFPLPDVLEYVQIIMSSKNVRTPYFIEMLFGYVNDTNKENVLKAAKYLTTVKEDYKLEFLYDYFMHMIKNEEKFNSQKADLILNSPNPGIAKNVCWALTNPRFESRGIETIASMVLLNAPASLNLEMVGAVLFGNNLIKKGQNITALQILTETEDKNKAFMVSKILTNNNAQDYNINIEMAAIANSCYGISVDIIHLLSGSSLLASLQLAVPMGRILAGEYDEEDLSFVREVLNKEDNLEKVKEMFKEVLKRVKTLKKDSQDRDIYMINLTKKINNLLSVCMGRDIEILKNTGNKVNPISEVDLLMSYTASKNGNEVETSELKEVLKKVK